MEEKQIHAAWSLYLTAFSSYDEHQEEKNSNEVNSLSAKTEV